MYRHQASISRGALVSTNAAREQDTGQDERRIDIARSVLGHTVDGRFELVKLIALGAVGDVYEARQLALRRPVALKLVDLSSEDASTAAARSRFKLEADTLARIVHPNVVSIIDVGIWHGRGFLAMELLEGRSLADVLQSTHRMPLPRLLRVARQICLALDATHRVGIVHRDLKPDNVLLTRFGGLEDHVKVIDFGVAKDLHGTAQLTIQGTVLGTPRYMAPEQIASQQDEIGPATDLYALGAILYRAALGRPVFPHQEGMAQLLAHMREDPPPFDQALPGHGLPPAFEKLVMRCLRKRAADRFPSARALDEALAEVEQALPRWAAPSLHVIPVVPGSLMAHERTMVTMDQVLPVDARVGATLAAPRRDATPAARPRDATRRLAIVGLAATLGAAAGLLLALRASGVAPRPAAEPPPAHVAEVTAPAAALQVVAPAPAAEVAAPAAQVVAPAPATTAEEARPAQPRARARPAPRVSRQPKPPPIAAAPKPPAVRDELAETDPAAVLDLPAGAPVELIGPSLLDR